jgi:hypothetical protein
MAYFEFKNPNLGKFWRDLLRKMLVYFTAVWYIFIAIWYVLWPLSRFYGYMVDFTPFWYLCTKKNLATLDWNGFECPPPQKKESC